MAEIPRVSCAPKDCFNCGGLQNTAMILCARCWQLYCFIDGRMESRSKLLGTPFESPTPATAEIPRGWQDPEVCICAAVRTIDGAVIHGYRHHDALRAAHDAYHDVRGGRGTQGFVTSRGRFVDRLEGRRLQDAAGISSIDSGGYRGDLLFSEDLY